MVESSGWAAIIQENTNSRPRKVLDLYENFVALKIFPSETVATTFKVHVESFLRQFTLVTATIPEELKIVVFKTALPEELNDWKLHEAQNFTAFATLSESAVAYIADKTYVTRNHLPVLPYLHPKPPHLYPPPRAHCVARKDTSHVSAPFNLKLHLPDLLLSCASEKLLSYPLG